VLTALFPLFARRQLRHFGGRVITAMPSRISPTSRTFVRRGRTCPIDSWTASILTALKCTYALLLAEYEYTEWRPAAGPASSNAPVAIEGPGGMQNPNVDGTGHSNPSSALLSLVLPPLSILFVSSQGEGQHHSNLEAQQQSIVTI